MRTDGQNQNELEQRYIELYRCMIEKDLVSLSDILDSSFMLVHMMSVKDGVKVVEQAYDMGYTLFDTAECYTGINPDGSTAYNEEVVGQALRPIRDKVVLAAKCGVQHGQDSLIADSRPETIMDPTYTFAPTWAICWWKQ